MTTANVLEIRQLSGKDHQRYEGQLQILLKDVLRSTSQHIDEAIREALCSEDAHVFGALVDGFLVAVASGSVKQSLTKRTYLVDDVACHPEYQCQGIATKLMGALSAQAKKEKCSCIFFHSSRPDAQRFYEAQGFVEKKTKLYIRDL